MGGDLGGSVGHGLRGLGFGMDWEGEYENYKQRRISMAGKKKAERLPQGFSPCGIVEWAFLDAPQPPFEGKGEPKYKLTIALDPEDGNVKKWQESIAALTKFKGMPWKVDEESGKLHVTFKTLRPVKVYDSVGKPLPEGKWPGRDSVVRVAYVPNEFAGLGGGINLYLQGVQVIEMVEGFGTSVKFPVEEGAYVGDGISKTPAEDGSAKADDDNPF